MCFHDLAHDREAEPGAGVTRILAAPESIEQMHAILLRDTAAVVGDADLLVGADFDDYLGASRCVCNRILDKVSQCVLYGMSIASDAHRLVRTDECN